MENQLKMEICALASGSSGNCFYISNKNGAILVDAGISARQICERLEIIGKNTESVKGIFVTHEHSDHIKGIDVFARNFNVPIFATKKTINNSFLCSDKRLVNAIKNNETIKFNGMEITAFPKSHEAVDPIGFSIYNNKKISVITDAGRTCKNITENVADSDFLCLESNHDVPMLENGPYPWHLKKWIKSDTGHLSNMQASLCVLEHGNKKLKHVMLSHLSQTNNTPDIALDTFNTLIKERSDLKNKLGVSISMREMPTKVFKI